MFANLSPWVPDKERLVSTQLFGQTSDMAPEKLAPYRPGRRLEILDVIPEGPRECVFHHADKTCYFATSDYPLETRQSLTLVRRLTVSRPLASFRFEQ
jgi:hypothetical protein